MRAEPLVVLLVLGACSSPSSPPAPAPPAPPPPAEAPPSAEVTPPAPSAPAREPRRVDPERARSALRELRELRRMVREGELAAAGPRFVALARREPGNPRLHCEAGYVAQQAGDPASADTELEAGLAIYRRMGTVPPELRVPFAMCLYNRGLLAEEDGDGRLAAELYRQSLALRPNATVERHLVAAEAMPDGAVLDAEDVGDTVSRRAPVIAGARSATIVRTDHASDEGDVEAGCFDEAIEVVDPQAGTDVFPLAGACEDTNSVFRDWASTGEPRWVDAGPPWGLVATVESEHGGCGDDIETNVVAIDDTTTLFLLAVVEGRWRVGSAVISRSSEADCDDFPCDDPSSSEDDADDLPAPYRNAFSLRWSLSAGVLLLSEERREGDVDIPAIGPQPLSTLLGGR